MRVLQTWEPSQQAREWRRQCELLRDLVFLESARASATIGSGFLLHTKRAQLDKVAERVLVDLRTRKRRGALGLEQMYQGSLARLGAPERRDVMLGFCQSGWFGRYGEVVGRPQQICIEEAFYRFLCDEDLGPAELRRLEFLDAIVRALAVQPSCAFALPAELHMAVFGHFALATLAGQNMLVARVEKALVRGPISQQSAAFLRAQGVWSSAGELSRQQWQATRSELALVGIVF